MILESDFVTTTIEEVESIQVAAIQEPDADTKLYSRCILVYTPRGDTFRLWLRADKQEKLALEQFPPDAWLQPKKYEGSQPKPKK